MHKAILVALVLAAARGPAGQSIDTASQAKPVAALQKLGVDVIVDETKPGKPVVGVRFPVNTERKATDEDLVQLEGLPNLRSVSIRA